ncbi:hypothetical protein F0562_019547 [Nyssa sinensis]|uniref:Uncharacterized protein n=1 Tax=Nyssa sinensis TaxID=561372 RepID=A0A5J5BPG2_9ASTE|nr:hypothetical protein F0562_019547 [Nyssa sinensis]
MGVIIGLTNPDPPDKQTQLAQTSIHICDDCFWEFQFPISLGRIINFLGRLLKLGEFSERATDLRNESAHCLFQNPWLRTKILCSGKTVLC